ncbi:MAG: hypothetical protein U9R34_04205 [Nanoarchaeota archaeon]|nr:hypothetical protein [Nanoarchaeota archaeon]
MRKKQLLIFPIVFSILSSIVFAAQKNWLKVLLEPFFGWNIAATYQQAASFIDFVLYIFIFLYITRYAISKRFEGATAKSLSVVIAIVLAVGMSVFERMFDFNLGKLAPLAGLILFAVIAMIAFNVIKGFGAGSASAGAWAYLLLYGILSATASKYLTWLYDKVPFFEGILYIGVIISIFGILKGLWSIVPITGGQTTGAGKKLWDITKKGASGVKGTLDSWKEKRRQKIAAKEQEIRNTKAAISRIETDINNLGDISDKLWEKDEYLQKEKQERLRLLSNEYNRIRSINQEINRINNSIQTFREMDRFGNDKRVAEAEQKLTDYNQKVQQYLTELSHIIIELTSFIDEEKNNLRNQIRESNETNARLNEKINQSKMLITELKNELKDISRLLQTEKDKNKKSELENKSKVIQKNIKEVKDEEKKVVKTLKIETEKKKNMEKAIDKAVEETNKFKELEELVKEIDGIIKGKKYKKRVLKLPQTASAQKKVLKAEIQKLHETYKTKQDIFFEKMNKLYKIDKQYNGFHNKIRDLNKELKVLEKAGSPDDEEKIKIFQKSFPKK